MTTLGISMKREREETRTLYPIIPVVLGEVQLMEELERWEVNPVLQFHRITQSPLYTHLMYAQP